MIIVGTDGSQQSQLALVWAVEHAVRRGTPVQAVIAVDTKNADEPARQARLAEAEHTVERMVTEVVAAFSTTPPVTYEVVEGDPSMVMVDASQRAELLVFGAHRMSSIRRTALGTVSTACIRMGSCPVLVIPVSMPQQTLPARMGELVPA